MLSRTAETLFWTSRYLERADTTARRLEVGYRMSLMPSQGSKHASEWISILEAAGLSEQFYAKYGKVDLPSIEKFLVYDRDNPASIVSCMRAARNNARSIRTAITSDVWTALNTAYLELKSLETRRRANPDLPTMCNWVKKQTATVRGAHLNTQLHDDGLDFYNIGFYLERADNTARILDIKYHVLLPTIDMVGGGVDNYQWTTLLRALAAYRSFYWAYHGDFSPEKIADFLILNPTSTRSLKFCLRKVYEHLGRLDNAYGRSTQATGQASALLAQLEDLQASEILAEGLHEFLIDFIGRNSDLANHIGESFLFGER
ncbi:MAG: alpha-E domain-containing protein [Pseudomonadota bacterium]